MIKVTNLTFDFPQKDLYKSICFQINEGDHAVLIGSNGTGKSTLITMIMDHEKYLYDGKIEMPKNLRIGHVSQYTCHEGKQEVFDYLAEPFVTLLAKADEAGAAMAEAEDMDAAFAAFQEIQDEIDAMDAYQYDNNIKKQLANADLDYLLGKTVDQISGGEYKLLSILRNMLVKPQFLIMDEPDVFLDFENLISLSKMINNYQGTLLVITHNRLLLGQCFDKILHLENGELMEFPGTFAEYNHSLLETKVLTAEQALKDQEWIEIQEKLVERLRNTASMIASSKRGAQVHARQTYLERLQARKTKDPFVEDREFHLQFPEVSFSEEEKAEIAIACKDYSLTYETTLLKNVNFEIHNGEKVALVGANGTGKSSMLRDIVAKVEAEQRENEYAYFTQIYEDTEQLSGGEKNLKELYKLGDSTAKTLILDEPTSHLDLYAQMALEKAISTYQGTVFMVSHDFFTVVNCVDRIFMIEEGTVREMSARAFRKFIYKNYFKSDIFEEEKNQKDLEIKINQYLKNGKIKEAKALLGLEA